MLPEEKARVKIDKQMRSAGWDIVSRGEYISKTTSAVKEALMQGNTESDYLLFIDDKTIAVVEAKKEDNPLGPEVVKQAEIMQFIHKAGMVFGLMGLFRLSIWQMEIRFISRTCSCRIAIT